MMPTNDLRILFVDDEPRLLDALSRCLHADRHRWFARFAKSAEEALVELAREPADVIVTDMRMPGLDGIELLQIVARDHPGTVRVMLSGQADVDSALRAAEIAHQFLAKPIMPAALRTAIERIAAVWSRCRDANTCSVITAAGLLPVSPDVFDELNRIVADPTASSAAIGRCVERDSALCARLLQLVNSAFVTLAVDTASVEEAVRILGTDVLRRLLASDAMRAAVKRSADSRTIREAQKRSSIAAAIARGLAPAEFAADAYVVALLSGLDAMLGSDASSPASPRDVGHLLALWGLPARIVAAIGQEPDVDSGSVVSQLMQLATRASQLAAGEVARADGGPWQDADVKSAVTAAVVA